MVFCQVANDISFEDIVRSISRMEWEVIKYRRKPSGKSSFRPPEYEMGIGQGVRDEEVRVWPTQRGPTHQSSNRPNLTHQEADFVT